MSSLLFVLVGIVLGWLGSSAVGSGTGDKDAALRLPMPLQENPTLVMFHAYASEDRSEVRIRYSGNYRQAFEARFTTIEIEISARGHHRRIVDRVDGLSQRSPGFSYTFPLPYMLSPSRIGQQIWGTTPSGNRVLVYSSGERDFQLRAY